MNKDIRQRLCHNWDGSISRKQGLHEVTAPRWRPPALPRKGPPIMPPHKNRTPRHPRESGDTVFGRMLKPSTNMDSRFRGKGGAERPHPNDQAGFVAADPFWMTQNRETFLFITGLLEGGKVASRIWDRSPRLSSSGIHFTPTAEGGRPTFPIRP